MAYAIISKPGTEFGPCAEACEHRDCASMRSAAKLNCRHCHAPIGYERGYCADVRDGGLMHFWCAVADAEKAHQAVPA